jgi:hypothetical protein
MLNCARRLTDNHTKNSNFHGAEAGGSLLGALVGQYAKPSLPVILALNAGLCELAWDSYQDFKTFTANETGEHTKLRQLFAPTRASPGLEGINKVMATFSSDPLPAFRAPVTEIALATLKPGADSQSIAESVAKIVAATADSGRPALGAVVGSIIDDDLRSPPDREQYQLVLVTGWNSVEVCPHCAPINDASVDPSMLGPRAGGRK